VVFSDEKSYDWLYETFNTLNIIDALPLRSSIDNKNFRGGGLNDFNNNILIVWQIIGSDVSKNEMLMTGNIKLFGHLFTHAVQTKILENFKNYLDFEINKNSLIKITDYPCWFIEGQSDYHTLKLLDGDFNEHRNNYLTSAYVPVGWREKIKSFNTEEWKNLLIKDYPFEGIPITHQYWSGFFIYEYLIKLHGIDLIMKVMLDFPKTMDFNKSMEKILKINIESFYDTISVMLFNLAKMVRTG
jgi:hypothetical protein